MKILHSLISLATVSLVSSSSNFAVIGEDVTIGVTPFPTQDPKNWVAFNNVMKDVWFNLKPATTIRCGAFQIQDLTSDQFVGDKNVTIALIWNELSFKCETDTKSSLAVSVNMTMVWDTVAFPRIGATDLVTCNSTIISQKAEGIFKNDIIKDLEKKIIPLVCTKLANVTNAISNKIKKLPLPITPNKPIPRPAASIAEKPFAPYYNKLVKFDVGAAQFATRFLTLLLNVERKGMPLIDDILSKENITKALIPIGTKIPLSNIPYLDDIVNMNLTIKSFEINGLNKIASINLVDVIGDYTIRNSINMSSISFDISVEVDISSGSLVTPNGHIGSDVVNMTVAMTDAFLIFDLLLAFDKESMMNTGIGGFNKRPLGCLLSMLSGNTKVTGIPVGFDLTFLDIQMSSFAITQMSSNPGFDEVFNTILKGIGAIWYLPVSRLIRDMLQSVVRPLLSKGLVDFITISQQSDNCPSSTAPSAVSDTPSSLMSLFEELKVKEKDLTVVRESDVSNLGNPPLIYNITLFGSPVNVTLKEFESKLFDEPKNATVTLDVGVQVSVSDIPVHVELSFLRNGIDRLPKKVTTQGDTAAGASITSKIAPHVGQISDVLNGLREEMGLFLQTPVTSDVAVQEATFLRGISKMSSQISSLHDLVKYLEFAGVMSINEVVSYFLIHGFPKIPSIVERYSSTGLPISIKDGTIAITLNKKIKIPLPAIAEKFFVNMTLTVKTLYFALPSKKDLAIPKTEMKGRFTLNSIFKKVNTNFTVDVDLEVSPGPKTFGMYNNTVWSDTLSVGLDNATLEVDTRMAFDAALFDRLSLYSLLFTPMPCIFSPMVLDVNITKASKSGKVPFRINDIASGLSITSIQRTAGNVFIKSVTGQPIFGNLTDTIANIATAALGMTVVETFANVGMFALVAAAFADNVCVKFCGEIFLKKKIKK